MGMPCEHGWRDEIDCDVCTSRGRIDPDDAAHSHRREEARAKMVRNMDTLLKAATNLLDQHPRPWRWVVAVHDGLGIQFLDANGAAVLPDLIRDEELAADLFVTLGNGQ